MKDSLIDHPKVRGVQAVLIRQKGQELIYVSDPLGFSESKIVVTPDIYFIMALCDGNHSLSDIQYEYTRRFGTLLLSSRLNKIISDLDRGLFLENERFREHEKRIKQEFKEAPVRFPFHAGQAYPAQADALRRQMDAFFSSAHGPGPLSEKRRQKRVKAIIAPHIDLRAGGSCSAWAYSQLAHSPPPDVFVVLGIGHIPMENLFAITSKDFQTPLGLVRTDKSFVECLVESYPGDLLADEFAHRSEHSVEFQTIFLRYVFPEENVLIVPILCSSFQEMIAANRQPTEDPRVRDFFRAINIAAARCKRDVCFVAGADLSHIGQKFGDPEVLRPGAEILLESEDRQILKHVENVDAAGFFASVAKDNDKRRICGLPAIYILLNLIAPAKGRVLKYDRSVDHATQSVVSFASMVFE